MAKACACKVGLGNLGTPACTEQLGLPKKFIFTNYFGADGNPYSLPLTTVFDQTTIDGLINNTVDSERWYISPDIDNVTFTKEDTEFETSDSGIKFRVPKMPITTVNGLHFGAPLGLMKGYGNYKCAEIGVYILFQDGSLLYDGAVDGEIRPLRISKGSFDARFLYPTGTEIQKVSVQFDLDTSVCDEDLKLITPDSITGDLLGANGLIEAELVEASHSVNDIVFSVVDCYDSLIKGLVGTDITFFNTTDAAAVTGTLVEVEGVYTFTFDVAQDLGDVITVTIVKDGITVPVYTFTV